MRRPIVDLLELGPFPAERDAQLDEIEARETLVRQLVLPATEEEARAVIGLFGSDSLFGLAWALLHFIESAD